MKFYDFSLLWANRETGVVSGDMFHEFQERDETRRFKLSDYGDFNELKDDMCNDECYGIIKIFENFYVGHEDDLTMIDRDRVVISNLVKVIIFEKEENVLECHRRQNINYEVEYI